VEVIRELEADLVALQEVTLATLPGTVTKTHDLEVMTGYLVVPGPTLFRNNAHFGNALLSAHPVLDIRRHDLSVNGCEPRGLVDVDVEIHGARCRVMVTHLGLRPSERRSQTERLLALFQERSSDTVVLMGDFNEWRPGSFALRHLIGRFGPSPAPRTFPAKLPLLPLDRIWVKPGDALDHVASHVSPLSRIASDHLPLKALLSIP
jgi:endonuclease/exonuclease/phosphatase family metal-dependent hydrolase